MRLYLALLLLPLTLHAAPRLGWRDVATYSTVARLVAVLHDLGQPGAVPEDGLERLGEALPALVEESDEVGRRLALRLPWITRARLLERLPGLVDGLTSNEPYVRLALQRQRRRLDPRTPRRPLKATLRDYYRIALAKLRIDPGQFAIRTARDAGAEAELILRFEDVVATAAAAPEVQMSRTDEVIEYLKDFARLTFDPLQSRYLRDLLSQVDDVDAFTRAYRTRLDTDTRVGLAAALPTLTVLMYSFESAAVRQEIARLREQPMVLTPEMNLVRGLKTELFRGLGRLMSRGGLTTAPERFAAVERTTARALRWLAFERVVREGVVPTCADSLAVALRSLASDEAVRP